DMPAVADQPGHISSVVAGEIRIEPFDVFPGDCGIGQAEGRIPGIVGAAAMTRIAHMRREYIRHIGILDVVVTSVCRAVAGPVECYRREVNDAVPLSRRGEERRPGRNRGRGILPLSTTVTHRC